MSAVPFQHVQAVLFDLDGTLVDSAPDLGAAADQLRVARGLASLPLENYRSLAGAGARGMLSVAFDMTPEHPDFSTLREAFFANYEACILQRTGPFPGVADLVVQLQERGLRWGVVTNKAARFTQPLVQSMTFFQGAGAVVSGDTTPYSKPHPEPLLEAARRLGVDPQFCLYVGDDERDIVAGEAAGMKTVAAAYGYLGAKAVADWGADAVINSPLELLKLLPKD